MDYLFIVLFLFGIPLVWSVLRTLNFEHLFKQGKIGAIRVAYVIVTIIISYLFAISITTFVQYINNLIK